MSDRDEGDDILYFMRGMAMKTVAKKNDEEDPELATADMFGSLFPIIWNLVTLA